MGNAIGLVVDLIREITVKGLKGVILENVGMDLGDAIDAISGIDRHIGHMDLAVLDDGHLVFIGFGKVLAIHLDQEAAIDFLDDHVDARNKGLNIVNRPLLKRFRHDGVIGIGEDLLRDGPCLIPAIVIFVHHESHELRDGEDWMGIVKLEDEEISEIVEGMESSVVRSHAGLQTRGDEEILLTEAEHAAMLGGIVRIKTMAEFL